MEAVDTMRLEDIPDWLKEPVTGLRQIMT